MRKQIWIRHLLAYLAWAAVLALGIWVLLLSRDAVLGVVATLTADTPSVVARTWRLTAVERFYVIAAGLVWLAMMVAVEFYFRNGIHHGQLRQRFARVFGAEMLVLFVSDAVLFVVQGLGTVVWLRWVILGAELVLGVLAAELGRSAPAILRDIKKSDGG